MKHRYSGVAGQINIDGRLTKRPIVEVELSLGKHQRKFLALIDSGADQIIMPPATPLPDCPLFDIISNMTTLLEQAVERLRQLPEHMQNTAARALIFQLDQIEQGKSA